MAAMHSCLVSNLAACQAGIPSSICAGIHLEPAVVDPRLWGMQLYLGGVKLVRQ